VSGRPPTAVETWVALDGRWGPRTSARESSGLRGGGCQWLDLEAPAGSQGELHDQGTLPLGQGHPDARPPDSAVAHVDTPSANCAAAPGRRVTTDPSGLAASDTNRGSPRIEQPHLGTALDRAGPGRDGAQLDGEPDRARGTVGIVGRSLRRRGGATTRHGPVDRWAGGRRRRVRRRRDRSRRLGRGGVMLAGAWARLLGGSGCSSVTTASASTRRWHRRRTWCRTPIRHRQHA